MGWIETKNTKKQYIGHKEIGYKTKKEYKNVFIALKNRANVY
jgi:hypothetical protein